MNQEFEGKKPERIWEWREFKNGTLLENGLALNKTAAYIWLLCDGENTFEKIISNFSKKFKIKEEIAAKDVLKCIKTFYDEKAITLK